MDKIWPRQLTRGWLPFFFSLPPLSSFLLCADTYKKEKKKKKKKKKETMKMKQANAILDPARAAAHLQFALKNLTSLAGVLIN